MYGDQQTTVHWWQTQTASAAQMSIVRMYISMWKDTMKSRLQRYSIWSKERLRWSPWATEVSGKYLTSWTKDAASLRTNIVCLVVFFFQSSIACAACKTSRSIETDLTQGCRVVCRHYWPLVKRNQATIHEPDSQLHWWWLCNAGSMLANIVYLTRPRWRSFLRDWGRQ